MKEFFKVSQKIEGKCDPKMMHTMTEKLWRSFSFQTSVLSLSEGEKNTFVIGNPIKPELPAGKEYALSVSEQGIYIRGRDYGSLMRGFFVLLMKMEYDRCNTTQQYLTIPYGEDISEYRINNRMIHICVFPENDLYFIKKLIRLAALCQYTHIVIEFWGMLRYDCMKELAWEMAFTKEQAKELIDECRMLGIEPVPMFNQLGHATASRCIRGKHVVLDQNPGLYRLFSPDGWSWNIESPEVFALFKTIRKELRDLFGDGEYFHIGCDEAYFISHNEEVRRKLPQFLHDLTGEVEKEGRRPMMWVDMLMEANQYEDCDAAFGKAEEIDALRAATAPSTIFIDWQYICYRPQIPTLVSLKDCGRDAMGAPWYDERNCTAYANTIAEHDFHGIMLTTWHTLKKEARSILMCAHKCGAKSYTWSASSRYYEETATLMRHVSFEGNDYYSSGWSKEQIEV